MINLNNLITQYGNLDQSDLPDALKQLEFDFIAENLDLYNDDATIKEYIDSFIAALNGFVLSKAITPSKPKTKPKANGTKAITPSKPKTKPKANGTKAITPSKPKTKPKANGTKVITPSKPKTKPQTAKLVESYTEDVRLIRRFNAAIGRERQRRSILNIYRDFERRAVERKIKAESPYSEVIVEIQKRLKKAIDFIDKNNYDKIKIEAAKGSESFYEKVSDIAKSKGLRPSVGLLKRFIGIKGEIKPEMQKVGRLLSAFQSAIQKGKVCEIDLFWKEINEAKSEMESYLKGKTSKITISPQSLKGLDGIGLGKPNTVPKKKKAVQ